MKFVKYLINSLAKLIQQDSFDFYYQGKMIKKDATIIELTKSKATKEIVISVEKKFKKNKMPILRM